MLMILRAGVMITILSFNPSLWAYSPPPTMFEEEVNKTFCQSKLNEVLLFFKKYPKFDFNKMYNGMRPIWQVINCDQNDSEKVFKLLVKNGVIPGEMELLSALRMRSLRFTALVLEFGTFTTWNAIGADLVEEAKETRHKAIYEMVFSAKNASQRQPKQSEK